MALDADFQGMAFLSIALVYQPTRDLSLKILWLELAFTKEVKCVMGNDTGLTRGFQCVDLLASTILYIYAHIATASNPLSSIRNPSISGRTWAKEVQKELSQDKTRIF